MKVLCVLVLVAVASAVEYADEWKAWKEVCSGTVCLVSMFYGNVSTHFHQ